MRVCASVVSARAAAGTGAGGKRGGKGGGSSGARGKGNKTKRSIVDRCHLQGCDEG